MTSSISLQASPSSSSTHPAMAVDTPLFHKQKHVSYWLRCLRTPLPHQYTSNDANRMSLTFFILSALDILGALQLRTTAAERDDYANWIYGCQHPDGGFRAFPGTDFGDRGDAENAAWDPAHVPATYFALASLAILGDDFARVKRDKCLRWLTAMQRSGGSFGETLSEHGKIEGGLDTRFGYCAMGVRWMLRGNAEGDVNGVPDIDSNALIQCIRECETYDFGISQGPLHEAHAGLTYCAIGACYFLDRIPQQAGRMSGHCHVEDAMKAGPLMGISSTALTTKWLLSRLTTDIDEDESDDDGGFSGVEDEEESDEQRPRQSFEKLSARRVSDPTGLDALSLRQPGQLLHEIELSSIQWAGFNGRCNKLADTCYVFWVAASLDMLKSLELVPKRLVRKYLVEKTQHQIMGGFGKMPGALPDVYHAYLGLAALSLLGVGDEANSNGSTTGLERLDPALCFSVRAKEWIQSLGWREKS